jgi:hypothetical protein
MLRGNFDVLEWDYLQLQIPLQFWMSTDGWSILCSICLHEYKAIVK